MSSICPLLYILEFLLTPVLAKKNKKGYEHRSKTRIFNGQTVRCAIAAITTINLSAL